MFDDSAYRNKPGFIYLIHAQGTRRYKIGLTTRSVELRFNELNSSQSPYPLDLIESIAVSNVTESEEYLHHKFSLNRRHGEWFEFNRRELKAVLREFEKLENGYVRRFIFPSLPAINLPSFPFLSLPQSPRVNRHYLALAIAGMGSVWLMFTFSGCVEQKPIEPGIEEVS